MKNKKILLILIALTLLVLNTNSLFAYNLSTNISQQYKDLSLFDRYFCEYEHFEVTGDLPDNDLGYSLYGLSAIITTPFTYLFGAISGREQYCLAYLNTITEIKNNNNITNPYDVYSAQNIDQLGLEEYVYVREKEQILINVNTAWGYVGLMMVIVQELVLILFYFLQFYLVIYVLFISIPKVFLKIRDSLTMFLVDSHEKRKKKKEETINVRMIKNKR